MYVFMFYLFLFYYKDLYSATSRQSTQERMPMAQLQSNRTVYSMVEWSWALGDQGRLALPCGGPPVQMNEGRHGIGHPW